VLRYELPHYRFSQMSLPGDPWHLKLRCRWGDVRVEPRTGGGHEVDWHRFIRIVRLLSSDRRGDSIDQLLTGWTEI
jgi:hypothetical protein